MKANELRINNYVLTSLDKVDQVETIGQFSVFIKNNYSEQNETKLRGVPLTEEWLLNFGFEVIRSIHNDNIYFHSIRPELEIRLIGDEYDLGIETEWLKEIKHVHQLQNLFFALSGEELSII